MFFFWLSVLLLIFIFQAATILILEYRRPAYATAWMFILFLFPLVGFMLYYFLTSESRRGRKARRRSSQQNERWFQLINTIKLVTDAGQLPSEEFSLRPRLFHALLKYGEFPITSRNHCCVFNNGQDTYKAMLIAIRQARHHIHLFAYIVRDDGVGREFQQALIQKAREGIEVRVLYDGLGSIELKNTYIRKLIKGGVQCACFFPLRPSFWKKRVNHRNHRKITVVDGKIGFIGGINFGDEYLGKDPRFGYWRDTHLELRGDAVYWVQEVFLNDWEIATRKNLDHPDFFPQHFITSEENVQVVPSGPNRYGDGIHDSIFTLLNSARGRIWITTPYFIPSDSVAMALRDAAAGGLDVRIVLPSVADTWLVHLATLSYAEEMVRAGVRVWQYKRGFMHSKLMIVDDMIAILGSANMDLRSFFSNFEINVHLYAADTIAKVKQNFLDDLHDSEEIHLDEFMKRSNRQKVLEALARIFSPLL